MPVVALEQKSQILSRLLLQKDYSPFILICDSLAQSAQRLVDEFIFHAPSDVNLIQINLEHHSGQKRIDAKEIMSHLAATSTDPKTRSLVIIDNLMLIPDVGQTLPRIMRPGLTILGVYHEDVVDTPSYGPSTQTLLTFMATTVIKPIPSEIISRRITENPLSRLDFIGFNQPVFTVEVVHRRRSGRTILSEFTVDSIKHSNEFVSKTIQQDDEDPELLKDLTTFNLGTSEKQKQDRSNVDLPFLSAQEIGQGGAQGGAIIYEFEKDDDYDEEDPYEDPF